MKLVTWNCAMALKQKRQRLFTLGADVTVIQECSKADIEGFSSSDGWSSWGVGESKNKGLGVLARAPWIIRETQALKARWGGKLVIGGPASIDLFPVWAHKSESPAAEYIEQVHFVLDAIEKVSLSPFAVVIGDFNSNSKWDSYYGTQNHSAAVEKLRKLGMESAYHVFSGTAQGAERDPTHWNMKKRQPGYHIDYVFLSRPLLSQLRSVVVGTCDDWLSLSDHAPVIVELDLMPGELIPS